MKIACRWNDSLKHEMEFNELIIDFKMDFLPEMVKFLKNHNLQRIVINFPNFQEMDENIKEKIPTIFEDVINKYHSNNFTLRFPSLYELEQEEVEWINEKCAAVPYYFNTLVDDWDTLIGSAQMGVSDVLVVNSLGFSLGKVRAAIGPDINIRVYPNIAQSKFAQNRFPQFYIRPEGLMLYDDAIDVIEIYQLPYDNPEYTRTDPDTLFEIYMQDGKWFGELKELILHLNENIYSPSLPVEFDTYRINCDKKCTHHESRRKCTLCQRFITLSNTMKDNELIFTDSE